MSSTSGSARDGGERGIALILVLWVMALVALLAIGFAGTAKTDLQIVRNQYETARARTAADAAVSIAVLGALDKRPASQWIGDGRRYPVTFDGTDVQVSLRDEGGKIDLNAAPPELVGGLLQALGVDAGASAAMVETIVQRRQQTADVAEASDPEGASERRRPLGFTDIAELRLIPGMTRRLYERIAPFVTVYSRNARVDPITAPPEVLYAVPDLTRQDVETFLTARADPGAVPTDLMPILRAGLRYLAHRPLQTVTVHAEATTANKMRFVRTAVVSLTGGRSGRPYRVLAWDRGRAVDTPPAPTP